MAETVNVTGAGLTACNGPYVLASGSGYTRQYTGPVDPTHSPAYVFHIAFDSGSFQWKIYNGAFTTIYRDNYSGGPPGNANAWTAASWVDISGGTPVPTVTLYVPPEGTISGVVMGGPDCAGVLITFTAGGQTTQTAPTASDGTYTSPALADATWTATATKSGKTYTGPLTIVMSGGAGVTGQNFEETFSVSGVVETE